MFLHLVDGVRVPKGKGPLPDQSTRRVAVFSIRYSIGTWYLVPRDSVDD